MAEMNNQTFGSRNGRQDISITTNTVSMFDDSSVQLRVSGFQDSIQLAWWLPVQGENGRNTYPPDHRYSIVMAPERVVLLDKVLTEQILPSWQRGESISRGVFTNRGNTNLVMVEVDSNGEIYIYLHKDIDGDRKPKESFRFHFSPIFILTKYDPSTGEYAMDNMMATFYMFVNTIHAFATDGISGASAHSERYLNRYQTNRIMNYLTQIAGKLGIAIEGSGGMRTGNGGAPRGGFSNNSYPATQTPLRDVDDISSMIY